MISVYDRNIQEGLKGPTINMSFGKNSACYDLDVDPPDSAARVLCQEYALQ